MKLNKVIKKMKKTGFKEVFVILKFFLFNYTKYYIMHYKPNNEKTKKAKEIFIRRMNIDDIGLLSTEYFSIEDHYHKKNCILNKDHRESGYVFEDNNRHIIGYSWIMFKGSKYKFFKIKKSDAYISEMFINSCYRNNGYCAMVLSKICKFLTNINKNKICIAVRTDNIYAIKSYINAGFIVYKKISIRVGKKKVFPYHSL